MSSRAWSGRRATPSRGYLQPPGAAAGSPHQRSVLLGLCGVAFLVYLNSLANGFALDDQPIIVWNEQVHGLRNLWAAVTGPYWPATPGRLGLYRPVTLATFALDWELWGGRALGFHLVNVLLHVGVTALVFFLLTVLGAGLPGAAAGAAIFAVHPVHVEAVANVVGRSELLASGFFLGACFVYSRPLRGWAAAAGVAALYFLAMGSKEIAVTLPAALLLLHFREGVSLREGLTGVRDRWRVYAAVAGTLFLYLGVRALNIGTAIGGDSAPWFLGEPATTRIWTAIRIWPEYLRLMLFPAELIPDYGPGVIVPETTLFGPRVLLGLATGVAAVGMGVLCWRRARLVSVGLLWFAVTVLPVSGLLFPTGVLLAERTLFLPSVGLAIAVAGALGSLGAYRPEWLRPALIVLAVVAAGGAGRTWAQNPVWRDDTSVFNHLIAYRPENYRAQWAIASELTARGQPDRALDHLAQAVRMVPGYFNLRMEYGMRLMEVGRHADASEEFALARALVPEAEHAHLLHLVSLIGADRYEEAAVVGVEAAARYPTSEVAHHHLAIALARLGRFDEARAARMEAIRLDTGVLGWQQWVHLAAIEVAAGEEAAAERALGAAAEAAPPGPEIPTVGDLSFWLADGEDVRIPFW